MQHIVCAIQQQYCIAAADVEGKRIVNLKAFDVEIFRETGPRNYRRWPDNHSLGFWVDRCDHVRSANHRDQIQRTCVYRLGRHSSGRCLAGMVPESCRKARNACRPLCMLKKEILQGVLLDDFAVLHWSRNMWCWIYLLRLIIVTIYFHD